MPSLVLIGLALLLVFGVYRVLIRSGILPPVDRKTSGFWIAALLIVLGIAYAAYQTHRETQPAIGNAEAASTAVAGLRKELDGKGLRKQEYQDQLKALTATVQALANKQDAPGVKEALAALAEGQTEAAKAIFAKTFEAKTAAGAAANREAAEAARHLGALAFLDDTEEALRWYRRAVDLDPANADGWNQLGHLYHRTGPLDQAEAAFQKVITLGEANGDMEAVAAGTSNLRLIYRTRRELDRAEEVYKKELAIEEKLGRQEGMARHYGNLGLIYRKRGELDRAEEMYKKALAIDEKLGRQERMANHYGNLGILYQTRGEARPGRGDVQEGVGDRGEARPPGGHGQPVQQPRDPLPGARRARPGRGDAQEVAGDFQGDRCSAQGEASPDVAGYLEQVKERAIRRSSGRSEHCRPRPRLRQAWATATGSTPRFRTFTSP